VGCSVEAEEEEGVPREVVRLQRYQRCVMSLHATSNRERFSADDSQADWSEGFKKKKSAGVPDMTLLSTITNEEINKNLKERFNNQEIYVRDTTWDCCDNPWTLPDPR
jgi:myosin heavy subunit